MPDLTKTLNEYLSQQASGEDSNSQAQGDENSITAILANV